MQLAEAANGNDVPIAFGDQCHLAVIVDETNAREPLVGGALREFKRLKIAQLNGSVAEPLVDDHRFVFGTNLLFDCGSGGTVFTESRRDDDGGRAHRAQRIR
jgi:hypothetical protein